MTLRWLIVTITVSICATGPRGADGATSVIAGATSLVGLCAVGFPMNATDSNAAVTAMDWAVDLVDMPSLFAPPRQAGVLHRTDVPAR